MTRAKVVDLFSTFLFIVAVSIIFLTNHLKMALILLVVSMAMTTYQLAERIENKGLKYALIGFQVILTAFIVVFVFQD